MNRRSLLQALGLVAVAPVLPNIPMPAVAAELQDPLFAILAAELQDPLFAIALTEDSDGERYRHQMPATMHYREHEVLSSVDGITWTPRTSNNSVVIEFTSVFTGTVRSVEFARGDKTVVTLYRDAIESPYWTPGMLVRLTIGIETNPAEDI